MLQRILLSTIARQERMLGESLEYVRHILRTSRVAFFKFALFSPLAGHRKRLPADAYHTARMVAVQHADCGTCLQIEVNLARQVGVPASVVRAVLAGNKEALPDPLRHVLDFAKAVVDATGEEEQVRDRLLSQYGEAALVELALAIAAAQVYPVTKRALGYATSCRLIEVRY